jgi:DNA-binding cell septation regulator SpoVG
MKVTDAQFDVVDQIGPDRSGKLLAFCKVVLDDVLVLRDVKVIMGKNLAPFLAMPARRIELHCKECWKRNPVLARFCAWCGIELNPTTERVIAKADVVHPICQHFRQEMERDVIDRYYHHKEKSCESGS